MQRNATRSMARVVGFFSFFAFLFGLSPGAVRAQGDPETETAHAHDSHVVDPHGADGHGNGQGHGHGSRIPDVAKPLQEDDVPERPFTLELGNPFLGKGELWEGFRLPTGAVWQPNLLLFGSYRSAIQINENNDLTRSDWANRLDLNGNLQLSGTERFQIGFRPLDRDGDFSGYRFNPQDESVDGTNFEISTVFFEGDFAEIFPELDPDDKYPLDFGFAVGRQGILIQEGVMINDRLDSVGIARNTLLPGGNVSNWRATPFFAWDNVTRRFRNPGGSRSNRDDRHAQIAGLFNAFDFPLVTANADMAFLFNSSNGNGFFWGASGVGRVGKINTSVRVDMSVPLESETRAMRFGTLLFGELSTSPPWPHHTNNILYLNGFWGIEEYSSAARDFSVGGPLGRTGILFAAVGLGDYGAPLGNDADRAAGGSLGYQAFFDGIKKQVILEVGGRGSTGTSENAAFAVGARYQQAFHFLRPYLNWILRFDVFVGGAENSTANGGGRAEVQIKF